MGQEGARICIFAPSLYLTVTIETGDTEGFDHIHIHPGGQGCWIARSLRRLGERCVVVGPVGGETGRALSGLVPEWDIDLSAVSIKADTPAYVHDRRSGKRLEVAQSKLPAMDRHEIDELYGRTLEHATATGLCVMTGRAGEHWLPVELFRRLGADLAATKVSVVGDLHGQELKSFLDGGPLNLLKVSDEDLQKDGLLPKDAPLDQRIEVIDVLQKRGAENVVVSASEGVTIARFGSRSFQANPPQLDPVEQRGSGGFRGFGGSNSGKQDCPSRLRAEPKAIAVHPISRPR